jgi:hypothetical protein
VSTFVFGGIRSRGTRGPASEIASSTDTAFHPVQIGMFAQSFQNLLLAGVLCLLLGVSPAAAQWENIGTVEGPEGGKMTLTKSPHSVAEGLSVRAVGVAAPDTTRWALSLIGAAPEDTISISYEGESVPILGVDRPSDGIGPTKVFVSQETFLTMAETTAVRLRVGDRTAPLPAQLRREMKQIFDRVT